MDEAQSKGEGKRAGRNRTVTLTAEERRRFRELLSAPPVEPLTQPEMLHDRLFCGDMRKIVAAFPAQSVDLLILDPPYNLEKKFHDFRFRKCSDDDYAQYLQEIFTLLLPLLKPSASIYWCGDWVCAAAIYELLRNLGCIVRNRITWQREKGRGAAKNWKNSCEDIFFATVSDQYYFDLEAVKLKRRVLAPYRDSAGSPKDWEASATGNFRLTAPGNFWDDITVPFWSMPENTDHPTQKPEKLFAKLILASCPEGGLVLDPFLGSGTTAVTAKKLGRFFCGIDLNEEYLCWALKRLELLADSPAIQGYEDGVFYERNARIAASRKTHAATPQRAEKRAVPKF